MKAGSKPETDIPTSGDSGSSSLPLCTEPIGLKLISIIDNATVYNSTGAHATEERGGTVEAV